MQGKKLNLTRLALSKLFKHGFSSIVFAIALFGVLVIVNYMVAIKTSFIDITKNKIHSLSPQSKTLLKELNYKVNIKAFYLADTQHQIDLILGLYKRENPLIDYEVIDPIKNPVAAQKYGVTLPKTLVFEAPNKTTTLDPPPPGKFNSETEITSALYRLISDQSRTIYFSDGHGELNIYNTQFNGYSTAYDRLKEQNYIVKTLNLQKEPHIPYDCSILVIADPTSPFTDQEEKIVADYNRFGGSVLIMVSPGLEANLDAVTDMNSIRFGNDFVYETANNRTTERGPTAPICLPAEPSPITKDLKNVNFVFPGVRSLSSNKESNLPIVHLLSSSEDSWAETDIESAMEIKDGKRPSRSDEEVRGPITVAITTEFKSVFPDSLAQGGAKEKVLRSAFFGSGGFLTNSVVAQFPGNMNLFLNTVNWITKNEKILKITPNTVVFTPVDLTTSERTMISWLSLFVFPFTMLFIGLVVWYKKR
jgi:ABC-2 type transport system permease protein